MTIITPLRALTWRRLDRAGVQQAYRTYAKPAPTDFGLRRTAIRCPGLPFNGLHSCNPCNCMDYYYLL